MQASTRTRTHGSAHTSLHKLSRCRHTLDTRTKGTQASALHRHTHKLPPLPNTSVPAPWGKHTHTQQYQLLGENTHTQQHIPPSFHPTHTHTKQTHVVTHSITSFLGNTVGTQCLSLSKNQKKRQTHTHTHTHTHTITCHEQRHQILGKLGRGENAYSYTHARTHEQTRARERARTHTDVRGCRKGK